MSEPALKRASALSLLMSQAAVPIFGIAGSAVLARELGPLRRGELAGVANASSLLAAFSVLGLPEALVFFRAQGRPVAGLANRLGRLALVVAVVGSVALTATIAPSAGWLYLVLILVGTLSEAIASVCRAELASHLLWSRLSLAQALAPLFRLVCVLSLAVTGTLNVPTAFAATMAAAPLITVGITLTAKSVRLPQGRQTPPEPGQLRYAAQSLVGTASWTATGRLDQLVLATRSQHRPLGLYAQAVTLAEIPTAIAGAVRPALIATASRGEVRTSIRRAGEVFAVALAMFTGLFVLARPIVRVLYGDNYADSVPLLRWLCVAGLLLTLATLGNSILMGLGRPGYRLASQLSAAMLSLFIYPVFIARAGATGAAAGSVVTYGLSAAITLGLLILTTRNGATRR